MNLNRRNFLRQSIGAAAAAGLAWGAPSLLPSGAFARPAVAGLAQDLTELTIDEAAGLLRAGTISPVDLVSAYMARIHRFNPGLNAYITVTEELAYEQARRHEDEIAKGHWRGPLHGIPIALKDNIDTAGVLTTGGSALYAERVPARDSEVARRLKDAGAVLLGKVNMHEFAYGDTTGISHFGPTRNPWHRGHIPGGSSGGSSAAVAARLCAAALGTDTGGSVRQPAAYCGVVGLKPTYGLVSIRGVIPLAETQDHVGPICKTVTDAALLLQVLAGYDPQDLWSIRADIPDYSSALNRSSADIRLGVPRAFFYEGLDPEIEKATEEALAVLAQLTASSTEVEVPLTELRVVPAESHAWHSETLEDEAKWELYQPPVLERLLIGSKVSAAEYIAARRQQLEVRRANDTLFEGVDLLVTPTSPDLPVTMEEGQDPSNPLAFSLRNTAPFNANGLPTISVPCGISRTGLPIGLQVTGPHLDEMGVFTLARAYEQATGWHTLRPELEETST